MFYKGLTSTNFQRIFCLTTSFSGINRTRQQAVFLRLLFGQLFKPFYGGLRKGNTKPSGNILRRLNAVVITRHLNYYMGGYFTKNVQEGIIMSNQNQQAIHALKPKKQSQIINETVKHLAVKMSAENNLRGGL
jgi:predicted membrane GTPase involved in stress response